MLNYGAHQIDEADIAAVTSVLRGSRITQGPEVDKFEEALAQQIGAAGVCVVSSGTAALHIAYATLGLQQGDEIITSPLTFVATANAARMLGAEVRFADIDPTTGNLDPQKVRSLVNSRTRGIVPVHFGGLPADLLALRELADEFGLWIVDDAAHALGARYCGKPIGGQIFCEATTFSFHPVKHITTAEGGAVAVQDPCLLTPLRSLREHGLTRCPEPDSGGYFAYEQHRLGYNYRLSDLQSALGRSQLSKLSGWVQHRQRLAELYRHALQSVPGVTLQSETTDGISSYHLLVALIDFEAWGVSRAEVRKHLATDGIAPQIHYFPVCDQPYYQLRYGQPHCPQAQAFYARELSLPLHAGMTKQQVWQVVNALKLALSNASCSRSSQKVQVCKI